MVEIVSSKSTDLQKRKPLLLFSQSINIIHLKSRLWVSLLLCSIALSGQAQLTRFYENGKAGFVNAQNAVVIPAHYEAAGEMTEGRAVVVQNRKYGFVNEDGALFIPLRYDDAGAFQSGLARVKQEGKYGFINRAGTMVIPCTFQEAYDFHEGLAKVKMDHGFGFIDTQGAVVLQGPFLLVGDFGDGLAPVMNEAGKWGYMDRTGAMRIPFEFYSASHFALGKATVVEEEEVIEIDIWGKKLRSLKVRDEDELEERAGERR